MQPNLTDLQTTQSGNVRKRDALEWFRSLDGTDWGDVRDLEALNERDRELIEAVAPKPDGFEGSTFAAPISNVRVTGRPEWITEVARRLTPLAVFESEATYLSINLQQVEDRDTGELTGNYALYLNAAERGGESKAARAAFGVSI